MRSGARPEDHLRLVYHEAHRIARDRRASGYHHQSAAAFVGMGYFGLVKACDAFDPSRGCTVATFAIPRIRGAILDELRNEDGTRRKTTTVELANDLVDARDNPLEHTAKESIAAAVRAAVHDPDLLTPREREIIVAKYWHDELGASIAARLGVSAALISLRLASAHEKLARALQPIMNTCT